jgi:putative ABC transport system ATP-binding protein
VSDAPAIEAVDVCKSFGRVPALDHLSLSIADTEYVAITGPSGCGKSTLLHLAAALDRPDSGSLRIHGVDVTKMHHVDGYRRNEVGLVFQLHNLLPHLRALENVEIAMLGTGLHRREERARARELLRAVDLQGRERRRPPELSGGERQRVAIARALANEPTILLADEPTGSLDSRSVEGVLDLLDHLRERSAITIVVVTHDARVAAAADRVIALQDGRVGTCERSSEGVAT